MAWKHFAEGFVPHDVAIIRGTMARARGAIVAMRPISMTKRYVAAGLAGVEFAGRAAFSGRLPRCGNWRGRRLEFGYTSGAFVMRSGCLPKVLQRIRLVHAAKRDSSAEGDWRRSWGEGPERTHSTYMFAYLVVGGVASIEGQP